MDEQNLFPLRKTPGVSQRALGVFTARRTRRSDCTSHIVTRIATTNVTRKTALTVSSRPIGDDGDVSDVTQGVPGLNKQPARIARFDGRPATPDNARHEGHVETPTHPEVDWGRAVRGDSGGVGREYVLVSELGPTGLPDTV
jgi:hypothetical protein